MTRTAYIEQLRLCPLRPKGPLPRVPPRLLEIIREHGVIEPVIVRPTAADKFEILGNVEAWMAAQQLRIDRVPIHVLEDLTDEEAAEIVTASFTGYVINSIDEAEYLRDQLSQLAPAGQHGAVTKLAFMTGHHRAYISHALRLLKLPESIQQLVRTRALSAGHARAIIAIDDPHAQAALAKRAISERLTVRQVESMARTIKQGSAGAGGPGTVRTREATDPDIRRLENKIAASLGCSVGIDTDRGKLIIDYYNFDILEGVLEKLGVENM